MAVWKITAQLEDPAETVEVQNGGAPPVVAGEFVTIKQASGAGYNREFTYPARRVVKVTYDRISA